MSAEIHLPAQKVQTLYSSIELHNTRGRGPRVWLASEDPPTPPSPPPKHRSQPPPPHLQPPPQPLPPTLNTFTKDSLAIIQKYTDNRIFTSLSKKVSFFFFISGLEKIRSPKEKRGKKKS